MSNIIPTTTTTPLDAFLADTTDTDTTDAPLAVAQPTDTAIVPAYEQEAALAQADAAVVEVEVADDKGPHPKIAKRIIFDGNAFDIPTGTPDVILNDNNALRRAYATAMARPEVTQAHMEEGTTVIDGHSVPTLTLRVRPQVKGVSSADTSSLLTMLARVPRTQQGKQVDSTPVKHLLAGRPITLGRAVRINLGNLLDEVAHPSVQHTYGGSLCSMLDTIPSDAGAALADLG